MARPTKKGLDYFALDVSMDEETEIIEGEHGLKGFAILIKLFQRIYSNGYYHTWKEKDVILFSNRVSTDRNTVITIVNDCVAWDVFDKTLYEKYSILTSRRIQDHYFTATYKRVDVEAIKEYLLIDLSDRNNIKYINVNKNKGTSTVSDDRNINTTTITDDKSTQSKVKESKVKESKVDDVVCAREEFNDTVREKPKDTSTTSTPVKPCLESEVVKAISRDISPTPSSIWLDEIDGYLKAGIQEDVILYAIQTAVDNNVRNWAYIRAILRDFLNNEIKTMDEVHDRERKRTKSKRGARDRPRLGDFTMSEESEKELDEFSEQRKVPLHIRMKQEGKL